MSHEMLDSVHEVGNEPAQPDRVMTNSAQLGTGKPVHRLGSPSHTDRARRRNKVARNVYSKVQGNFVPGRPLQCVRKECLVNHCQRPHAQTASYFFDEFSMQCVFRGFQRVNCTAYGVVVVDSRVGYQEGAVVAPDERPDTKLKASATVEAKANVVPVKLHGLKLP